MSEFTTHRLLTEGPVLRQKKTRFRPFALVLVPLAAILFQFTLTRFIPYLSYLELPLLITVYYSLMNRNPIPGLLFGCAIGLAEDSLARQPLGMFGIVKTLVGYFAASVSARFDAGNPMLQFVLAFFFYFFHQFFHWMLSRALLSQQGDFDVRTMLLFGLLNAVVAIPLFVLLDKIRE